MRLPIAAMVMICVAGILFFLFIGFNYAFHSERGLKHSLWDAANKTMDGEQLSKFNDLMPQLTQGFGIASALCFIMAIVLFAVEAFAHGPREGNY